MLRFGNHCLTGTTCTEFRQGQCLGKQLNQRWKRCAKGSPWSYRRFSWRDRYILFCTSVRMWICLGFWIWNELIHKLACKKSPFSDRQSNHTILGDDADTTWVDTELLAAELVLIFHLSPWWTKSCNICLCLCLIFDPSLKIFCLHLLLIMSTYNEIYYGTFSDSMQTVSNFIFAGCLGVAVKSQMSRILIQMCVDMCRVIAIAVTAVMGRSVSFKFIFTFIRDNIDTLKWDYLKFLWKSPKIFSWLMDWTENISVDSHSSHAAWDELVIIVQADEAWIISPYPAVMKGKEWHIMLWPHFMLAHIKVSVHPISRRKIRLVSRNTGQIDLSIRNGD